MFTLVNKCEFEFYFQYFKFGSQNVKQTNKQHYFTNKADNFF